MLNFSILILLETGLTEKEAPLANSVGAHELSFDPEKNSQTNFDTITDSLVTCTRFQMSGKEAEAKRRRKRC